ncbi:hypothetical protein CEV08_00845 [Bartonella tribocorum]|uniref:Uncharacterized protein n=1 Tax=Bartonella tribocorum TaxID=85701 RepID=A0A2M6UYA6_9HYPH|nr:hypothetical protein CEV08_00845 [Bartonella tribocorum]
MQNLLSNYAKPNDKRQIHFIKAQIGTIIRFASLQYLFQSLILEMIHRHFYSFLIQFFHTSISFMMRKKRILIDSNVTRITREKYLNFMIQFKNLSFLNQYLI